VVLHRQLAEGLADYAKSRSNKVFRSFSISQAGRADRSCFAYSARINLVLFGSVVFHLNRSEMLKTPLSNNCSNS